MTSAERDIWQALVDLDETVKARPGPGPKPELSARLARLDELTRSLPKEIAPDLRHFLNQRSYEKARLWLEGRHAEIARGGCKSK